MDVSSLLALLDKGYRPQQALFTTFALSLSFFEAYLLPRLRRAECGKITILTDPVGYKASLMERRVQRVGLDYALVPVLVEPTESGASAIFHPKLTYLWGDTDYALVGSGNLTFGGHGRNLEVLEVLTPGEDAQAFADLADFLDELTTSPRIQLPDDTAVRAVAERARRQAALGTDHSGVRLLHPLNQDVQGQLVHQFQAQGPWRELLVLSPFHHPQGEPVRELAEALEVELVSIGVPGGKDARSPFPFAEAMQWAWPVRAVKAITEQAQRQVHGKWIELRGERANWALSGSVNATAQSLGRRDNVELAVLRPLVRPSVEFWEETAIPLFEPQTFQGGVGTSEAVLFVELEGLLLHGQILGRRDWSGEWDIELAQDGEPMPGTVSVDSEGHFRWQLASKPLAWQQGPLQCTLTQGERRLRGWVAIPQQLGSNLVARRVSFAVHQLLQGNADVEEAQLLLHLVTNTAQAFIHRTTNTPTPVKEGRQGDALPSGDTVDYGPWLMAGEDPTASALAALGEIGREGESSARTLAALLQLLAGPMGRSPDRPIPRPQETEEEEDDELSDTERRNRNRRRNEWQASLGQFSATLESLLRPELPSTTRANLLLLWLVVDLSFRRHCAVGLDPDLRFCDRWQAKAAAEPLEENARQLLRPAFYGLTAALARRAGEEDWLETGREHRAILAELHERAERFEAGEVDLALAHAAAQEWLDCELGEFVRTGTTPENLLVLTDMVREPSLRKHRLQLLDAVRARKPIDGTDFALTATELDWVKGARRPERYKLRPRTCGSCVCGVALIRDLQRQLAARRIARCLYCETILLSVEP